MEVLPQCAYIGDASEGPNPINSVVRYFPILLIAGLLGEIASIIVVGRWLGVLPTLALVVLGILLGVRIIRSAGLSIAEALRQKPPERGPADAFERVLVAGAGLLLILPGFLSDLVALFILIPSTRRWLGQRIAGRVKNATAWPPNSGQGQVIEGVAVEIERENRQVPDQTSANPTGRE